MNSNSSTISLIIPTHQRTKSLRLLLKSIFNCQSLFAKNIEVLVVSNLDDKEVRSICESFGDARIKYLYVGEVGVNRARNKGLEVAKSPYLLFLDDDCLLPSDFDLEGIIDFAELSCESGHGGTYLKAGKNSLIGLFYFIKLNSWLKRYRSPSGEVFRLLGGSLLLKTARLGDLRFDSNNKYGGAETELILRMIDLGHKFRFNPQLNVYHSFDLTFFDYLKKTYKQCKFHHQMRPDQHRTYETNDNFTTVMKSEISAVTRSVWLKFCFKIFTIVDRMVYIYAKRT